MDPLTITEIVVGAVLGLLLFSLFFIWSRRRFIDGGGRPVMLCARRKDADGRWRLGLARLGSTHVEWFSIIGPSLRPEVRWSRHELELGAPAPLAEQIPGLPGAVFARASGIPKPVDIAIAPAAYTAVRSWLESAPPGETVSTVS